MGSSKGSLGNVQGDREIQRDYSSHRIGAL